MTSGPAEPAEALTVQTPEQARLLLDGGSTALLSALLGGPLSAGEAAKETRQTLKQAHHRLTRLHAAGLVTVCGERKRAGRAVKLYQAAARAYRVPLALTDAANVAELLRVVAAPALSQLQAELVRSFRHEQTLEVLVTPDAHGQFAHNLNPVTRMARERDVYGAFASFGELGLGADSRRELERRLREVLTWARERAAAEKGAPDAVRVLTAAAYVEAGE